MLIKLFHLEWETRRSVYLYSSAARKNRVLIATSHRKGLVTSLNFNQECGTSQQAAAEAPADVSVAVGI